MGGTFQVEWLSDGILLVRRTGMMTPAQAENFVAEVQRAIRSASARWGLVVDTREAGAQTEEVQALIEGLIKDIVQRGVMRVAFVSTSAITGMQQRRMATAPGMHNLSTTDFYTDYDEALKAVREAIK